MRPVRNASTHSSLAALKTAGKQAPAAPTRLARTTAASQNAAREARELERAAGAAALALRQAEIELARTQGKVPRE